MKRFRFMNLLVAWSLALALTTVSPVAASESIVGPPMQSGTILTAVGQMNETTGDHFIWTFDFDPIGGPVNNSYSGEFVWEGGGW